MYRILVVHNEQKFCGRMVVVIAYNSTIFNATELDNLNGLDGKLYVMQLCCN